MMKTSAKARATIIKEYRLEGLQRPAPLEALATRWGVRTIKYDAVSSHGMLLKGKRGYTIILNPNLSKTRQSFSLAHELGHLLLFESGFSEFANGLDPDPREEKLCDEIAAEIIMPRLSFVEDGWMEGWSLKSLRTLSRMYETSLPATAIRMVDLMPEPCVVSVWRPATDEPDYPKLLWNHSNEFRYGVPNGSTVPRQALSLLRLANISGRIESGLCPVVDKESENPNPAGVPSEGLAWGRGDYRQVAAFHYPERDPGGVY